VADDTPACYGTFAVAGLIVGLCRVFLLVRWGGMERRVELFAAIRFDWQRCRMPVRARGKRGVALPPGARTVGARTVGEQADAKAKWM
jgi:hypothetical protein